MHLRLPHTLHYPITITELHKNTNDEVARFEPLFSYFYRSTVAEDDEFGETHQVEKTFPARFESSVDGTLKRWKILKGTVITTFGQDVAEIEEPCSHGVQFGGMCVNCGKDMEERSYVTNQLDTNRAQISMIHDNVSLRVSEDEATKVEEEAKRRLLSSRKLSLVVDLDQTIIQATVDTTIGKWQEEPDNPNYESVKEVRKFQLVDDAQRPDGNWYYVKLRPGLVDFLENVSKKYELHIYTMGTRAYAQNIANIIDPDRKIFGDRILSRDESGSLTAKNLQRLFPVDTKMVVIIDDRGDVWKWNENLIKVTPYDFFVGIGDINASFLPKKPKMKASPKLVEAPASTSKGNAVWNKEGLNTNGDFQNGSESKESALEQLLSMGGGDDPTVLQTQTTEHDETLAAQAHEQPLLQLQKRLEADADAAEAAQVGTSGDDSHSDHERPRHNLLHDDDEELLYLEQSLLKVHQEFFDTYSRQLASAQGGRVSELRGSRTSRKKTPVANLDLEMVPDIKTIMPAIKRRVLAGVVLVFSGVVPLGTDVQASDIARWAKSFGAKVEEEVSSRRTTHVIAARNRTAKVRQAIRKGKGRIKVVSTQWLTESLVQWKRQDEGPYLLRTEAEDVGRPFPGEEDEILSESEEVPSAFDTDADITDREDNERTRMKQLQIKNDTVIDEEDLADLLPGEVPDPTSPIGGTNADWKSMHDEIAEFLGSDDDDDSDLDSIVSGGSDRSGVSRASSRKVGKKSKRSVDDELPPMDERSAKRQSMNRGTNLSFNMSSDAAEPDGEENGREEDEVMGDEDGGEGGGDGDGDEDEDGWGSFEEELEAELERDAAEAQANGEG
jgi:RNA polymerase II subunit A-like phosphatase